MIRHLALFSVRDPADLDVLRETFATLATIPGVRAFEVGENRDVDDRSDVRIDLVVHAVFDDEAALAAYRQHPTYLASVARVRPLRELRVAVDYEVDDPAPPPPG